MANVSSDDECLTPPKKKVAFPYKRTYTQKFRTEWLSDSAFKAWLVAPRPGSRDASCKFCQKTVSCSKTSLQRHSETSQHMKAASSSTKQRSLAACIQNQVERNTYKETTAVQVASFISENNLPVTLSETLLNLIKARAPKNAKETNSLKEMHMAATKCTNVIRQATGLYHTKQLVDILRSHKFSIIPDETTDISSEKQLGICIMYMDEEEFTPVTRFFDMISVDDGGAMGLHKAIKQAFEEKGIPISNIIGFSSDTCNVMFGEFNGLATLMSKDIPGLVAIKCSCHMIHLCASHACLKLSTSLEDLCRNIYAHFSRSSLRQKEFKQFQEFVEAEPHKILSCGQTRWLSLESCISRILEQWAALQLYFTDFIVNGKDPSYTIESIMNGLRNPFVQAQLEFMQDQLHRMNNFNTMFQTTEPMLHHLREEVVKLLRSIMQDFLKLDVVRAGDPLTIDFEDKSKHVPLKDVYVGINASTTLASCSDIENALKVRGSCLAFMIELVKQIRTRFQVNKPVFKCVEFLLPSNAVKCKPPSLQNVFTLMPFLRDVADSSRADLEWRQQALEEGTDIVQNQTATAFWKNRLEAKMLTGGYKYPNLRKVISTAFSLPFSNASVERLFSSLKLVKTSLRSSLKRETLVGLMHTNQGMKAMGIHAHQIKLDRTLLEMVQKVKSSATDSEAHELVKNELSKIAEN
eukprot:gene11694-12910_t